MRDPLKKITITFLLIAMAPVVFIIYEFSQIGRNEQIVRETYQNQLDAILYSVNQYSDDLISSWANRIRLGIGELETRDSMITLISQAEVVRYVYMTDLKGHSETFRFMEGDPSADSINTTLNQLVIRESEKLDKLIQYERAGFRKMEALDEQINGRCIPIFFAFDERADFRVGAMVIDLPAFISHGLGPKLQSIAQGKFILTALRIKDDSVMYVTDASLLSADVVQTAKTYKNEIYKKDFWTLPGYYMGISLKGITVDELVRDRSATNLILLALLAGFLIAGILFLYRNIRREVHLSQAKSEFVSNVSHEIRTPLSLIGLFAETLEAGRVPTEEKKMEYYGIISKEASRLTRIVNRILNFSQLEASKKRFTFSPLELQALCKEILETYFYQLKDKGFLVEFIQENDVPSINGDREAVMEVIINLLDNAVKYSDAVKHIKLKLWSDQRYAYVEVSDKGIGIAKRHHTEIFDQFFRAPSGDVHTTKGSGLGLSLVKRIMEAHQGDVTVESSPGKGSTFRLLFPIHNKS